MALNYTRKIEALVAAGILDMTTPGVSDVDVRHDDWCDVLRGKPNCNCDPDIYQNGRKLDLPARS